MILALIILSITILIAYFVYEHLRIIYKFKKAGLRFVTGIPVLGNAYGTITGRKHITEDLDAVYRQFPNDKYVGYVEGTQATILVRDPEVIKSITVRDFDHFVDHKQFVAEDMEPLLGGSVFFMRGERWKHMRTTLTPAFTSSKMKHMVPFISEISTNIVNYLKENHNNDVLDITDVIRRYMNDVITSTGFGIVVNSLKDRENEFYTLGQDVFTLNAKQRLTIAICNNFPTLAKAMGLKVLAVKSTNFFKKVMKSTMEYRQKYNIRRHDMIQLLMESSKEWNEDELAAQVFTFFAAGFDSSSYSLILCLHELALHPDIQERLYQEIREFKEKYGEFIYDKIGELKFMDCVVNETLRKWTSALMMHRVCVKDYELPPPHIGGKPYTVREGDIVYNVVNSIHMDPKYFPDPEKFDPDRFSDENKHLIKPFTFMPFGMGFRACIGMRFAILELKVLLFDLIYHLNIHKCEKTLNPIVLAPADINLRCGGGSFIRLQKRDNV